MSSQVQCISIVKRKANFTLKRQTCKGHEKRDRLLISKLEIKYQISQRNKFLPIDPAFSNWFKSNKKVSIINCSTISKSFKVIYFFFEIQKLKVFEKTRQFFFSFLTLKLLVSNCQLALFIVVANMADLLVICQFL